MQVYLFLACITDIYDYHSKWWQNKLAEKPIQGMELDSLFLASKNVAPDCQHKLFV